MENFRETFRRVELEIFRTVKYRNTVFERNGCVTCRARLGWQIADSVGLELNLVTFGADFGTEG